MEGAGRGRLSSGRSPVGIFVNQRFRIAKVLIVIQIKLAVRECNIPVRAYVARTNI